MTEEEIMVLAFMRATPEASFSARELARKAGGRTKFTSNPDWAKPVIMRLLNKELVERDSAGHYRLKPEGAKEGESVSGIALSPQIKEILRKSGRASWLPKGGPKKGDAGR